MAEETASPRKNRTRVRERGDERERKNEQLFYFFGMTWIMPIFFFINCGTQWW